MLSRHISTRLGLAGRYRSIAVLLIAAIVVLAVVAPAASSSAARAPGAAAGALSSLNPQQTTSLAEIRVELRSGSVDAWHVAFDGPVEDVTLGEHWEIPVYDQDNEVAGAALTPCAAPCLLFAALSDSGIDWSELAVGGALVDEEVLAGPLCTKHRIVTFWFWRFKIASGTGLWVDGECR